MENTKTLTAETQSDLEYLILDERKKGYKPIGNVINIDGMYKIKMIGI